MTRRRRLSPPNRDLLEKIRSLKAEHPFWGYRRIWAWLRHHDGHQVNPKRIFRLMKESGLLVPRKLQLKAVRASETRKPRTFEPNRFWGIDMTKIRLQDGSWAYLQAVLDWGSKKVVGWSLESRSRSGEWLEALNMAVQGQYPNGIRDAGHAPELVSDNGCQPTSESFAVACKKLGIGQIFTAYNNPRGNADTERFFRTIKEDLIWIREWLSFASLKEAIADWIVKYNTEFPHSSIGWMTPYQYERWYQAS